MFIFIILISGYIIDLIDLPFTLVITKVYILTSKWSGICISPYSPLNILQTHVFLATLCDCLYK